MLRRFYIPIPVSLGASVMGGLIISAGVALIVFCAFITSRDVIPVIAQQSRFQFLLLNFLVGVFSFNILFHYVCAAVFSKRIGKGYCITSSSTSTLPHSVASLCKAEPVASKACLNEIDRIAKESSAYTATERRLRLLDDPKRFCKKCMRWKAPREHHCKMCGVCVCKMDHHCPWVNNCVDVENNRYFFLFLLWLTVGSFLDFSIPGYAYYKQRKYETATTNAHLAGEKK